MINGNKLSLFSFSISAAIFLLITLIGVTLPDHEEITYWILSFFVVMPLVSLIISMVISRKHAALFWLYPLFAGVCGMLIPFIVFGALEWISLIYGFIPAVLGLGVGLLWRLVFKSKNKP